jgi:hypothetical protein
MQRIAGHEYPISKIFSEEFEFHIPGYQRPYAWTIEQAGELFDDLQMFMQDQGGDGEDPYFLGSIVLIKKDGDPRADVIDGQQRLTTLTILLAALRAKCSDDRARAIDKYINEPGDLAEDRSTRPRLTPRERDISFFRSHIQKGESLDQLMRLETANLSDPQRNMQANAKLFVERLGGMDEDAAFAFLRFVVNRCFLVAVSTPSMRSAYRIFSVMNDRGLDLLTCDILKSDIIGTIPSSEQDSYTDRWEEVEELLGRDAFNELFTHIRMIYVRSKAKRNVLEEFRDGVLSKVSDGRKLIGGVIEPYAEAFSKILRSDYRSAAGSETINELLAWLRRIENTDWVPPAVMFMRDNREDADRLSKFLAKLERLAATMFIRRVDVNKRIERYAKVIVSIEAGTAMDADSALSISELECAETVALLDGKLYESNAFVRSYVLLRLDRWLSDGAAVYDHKTLTVEHVLPQTMTDESKWANSWDQQQHEAELHRIGNLVLLTRKKNSQAQNYDFDTKKQRYFQENGGVSSFAITSQVLASEDWTPPIVAARQRALLKVLRQGWSL